MELTVQKTESGKFRILANEEGGEETDLGLYFDEEFAAERTAAKYLKDPEALAARVERAKAAQQSG